MPKAKLPSSLALVIELTRLDWEVHGKLNNVAESEIAWKILSCISQESYKLSYTLALSRFDSEDIGL